jgi:hypothetical protein
MDRSADKIQQYRLYRAPSTRLVMDLLQVQEELNIIIQITQQQSDLMEDIQTSWFRHRTNGVDFHDGLSTRSRPRSQTSYTAPVAAFDQSAMQILSAPDRPPRRRRNMTPLSDPMSELVENLHRELSDLRDLRDNSNSLVNRTIQLVNM